MSYCVLLCGLLCCFVGACVFMCGSLVSRCVCVLVCEQLS